MALHAVTANRLTDGLVVYLAPEACWTKDLAEAAIAETGDALQALEEAAALAVAERAVVAPYPIPVAIENGTPVATSVRERIRAAHRTTLTKDWYDVPL